MDKPALSIRPQATLYTMPGRETPAAVPSALCWTMWTLSFLFYAGLGCLAWRWL